ncbi:MAG: crotonase/enoyl-CoA hydratase family protein [Pseudomonadales bacterium]|nr:crotonase/enoyl-CoA hydratase family protein [Pseudomonadales bacterium]
MTYSLENSIAILRFDDGKANAVSHAFIDQMMDGLDKAEQEAGAVVVLGREGMFSAGFDLKEIQKGPEAAASLVGRGAAMMHRMFSYPMPLVAGSTGHAIAAGAFMLLASDTRVGASGDFRIGLNETAISMVLPVFGFELARTRLSKRHQTAAVIQAQLFPPEEARDAGFLDHVVDADKVEATCIESATTLAELPTQVYGAQKRKLRENPLARMAADLN